MQVILSPCKAKIMRIGVAHLKRGTKENMDFILNAQKILKEENLSAEQEKFQCLAEIRKLAEKE
jgi:hypothetical protein